MELPPKILIDSINDWCICHYKDKTFNSDAPSHFYTVIPVENNKKLIKCIITSKIDKKKKYYNASRPEAVKSLIFINIDTFKFLTEESVIDCNRAELISKEDLAEEIDRSHGFKIISRDFPDNLKEKVIQAIKNSPLVRNHIKKLL
ncbi:MAG: hypothetical protein HY096_12580 [Nitrospinae bacterium]|nr:hypothetical protein [Nitrospinota bacterium]